MRSKLLLIILSFGLFFTQNTLACSPNYLRDIYRYEVENNEVAFVQYDEQTQAIKNKAKVDGVKSVRVVPIVWHSQVKSQNIANPAKLTSAIDLYFTDGNKIIWNGKVMKNDAKYQPIDVQTFMQQGYQSLYFYNNDTHQYASDKNYIYYKGQRRDDNTGAQKIDLKKIRVLSGQLGNVKMSTESAYVTDGKGIFFRGRYLGSLKNHQLIEEKSVFCAFQNPKIIEIDQQVFVEGFPLERADAKSFQIKEWNLEKNHLRYTDKSGEFIVRFNVNKAKYTIQKVKSDF